MRILEKLKISNFKSIREQMLILGPLNIFIGGNGSGKSNLIEVFKFLREILSQRLGQYTATKGGADALLYFGRKTSPHMELSLEFAAQRVSNKYEVSLLGTNDDTLIIEKEVGYYHERNKFSKPYDHTISLNVKESKLERDDHIATRQVRSDLESYRVYHFHDTSDTAAVKGPANLDDNRVLRAQAENLAAFLYWMKLKFTDNYANIEATIRQIAPFFDGFRLEPRALDPSKIRLEWKERGSDAYFNASSLPDGSLRFICLATLLLQPHLPALVLLDEPELGLHPAAVTLLANLLFSAALRTQVIVATQSVTLVNQFSPDIVWTVDREDGQSVFRHLKSEDMSLWLDDYALGELWEKNVLGARP